MSTALIKEELVHVIGHCTARRCKFKVIGVTKKERALIKKHVRKTGHWVRVDQTYAGIYCPEEE